MRLSVSVFLWPFYHFFGDSEFCLSQCCAHIETSQLVCTTNQLTVFYMRATLGLNGLNCQSKFFKHFSFAKKKFHNSTRRTFISKFCIVSFNSGWIKLEFLNKTRHSWVSGTSVGSQLSLRCRVCTLVEKVRNLF